MLLYLISFLVFIIATIGLTVFTKHHFKEPIYPVIFLNMAIGILIAIFFLGINQVCFVRSVTYNVPLKTTIRRVVTADETLTVGSTTTNPTQKGYLITTNDSKHIDVIKTTGNDGPIANITASTEHTDTKWFGWTIAKNQSDVDYVPPKTVVTLHFEPKQPSALDHFFK